MHRVHDIVKPWHASYRIEKFADLEAFERGEAFAVEEFDENVALNVGKAEIWDLVIGASVNHFDSTNTRLGVGDSTTAAANTQTDLLAATNKTYKTCDVGYPIQATTTTTDDTFQARATFGGAEANHGWKEFVVKNNASGICLNRKVDDKGTKSAGQIWILTVSIASS